MLDRINLLVAMLAPPLAIIASLVLHGPLDREPWLVSMPWAGVAIVWSLGIWLAIGTNDEDKLLRAYRRNSALLNENVELRARLGYEIAMREVETATGTHMVPRDKQPPLPPRKETE